MIKYKTQLLNLNLVKLEDNDTVFFDTSGASHPFHFRHCQEEVNLANKYNQVHNSAQYIYFSYVHVSGNHVPIIRRNNCIYATLVFVTLYECRLVCWLDFHSNQCILLVIFIVVLRRTDSVILLILQYKVLHGPETLQCNGTLLNLPPFKFSRLPRLYQQYEIKY